MTPGECGSRCQTRLYISLALSVLGTMINFSGYAAHATVYQVGFYIDLLVLLQVFQSTNLPLILHKFEEGFSLFTKGF